MRVNARRAAASQAIGLLLGLALLAGCGGRVSAGEVLAGAGGGTVTVQVPAGTLPQPVAAAAPVAPVVGASQAAAVTTDAKVPAAARARQQSSGSAPKEGSAKSATRTQQTSKVAPRAVVAAAPTQCAPGLPALRIGQVGHFSGILGPLTGPARTGLAAWAKDVNARGGIACRPIQLFVVDDAADAGRTASLVGQLVNEKKVVALVAAFSPLTSAALAQAAARHKVPVVGGDVASYEWHESPWFFPQGGGLRTRPYGVIKQAVEDGHTKFGLLYCVENPSCTTLAQTLEKEKTVEKAGGQVVSSSPVSLIQPDYTAQCQNAKNAGATALGVAMDGSAINRLLRSCESIGFRPPIVTDSLLISAANAQDPLLRRNGVISVNITAPWMLDDTPGQRAYRAAMGTYAPGAPLDSGSILAWTSGKLFEKAFAGSEVGEPTSAGVVAAMGRIRGETLEGLTPPLSFRPGKPAVETPCLYYTRLDEKGWSAPRGSKPVCRKGS